MRRFSPLFCSYLLWSSFLSSSSCCICCQSASALALARLYAEWTSRSLFLYPCAAASPSEATCLVVNFWTRNACSHQ